MKKKIVRIVRVGLLAIISAGLVGCASSKFRLIEKPIKIGDKEYQAMYAERKNPWSGNAVTVSLVESDVAQQPTCQPVMQTQHPLMLPTQQYAQQPVQRTQQCTQQQVVQAQQSQQPVELLTNTHVINNNNQGCAGWINGAFQGSVGDALIGGGMAGAGALLRPSHVSVNGGSGGQSSSVSAGGAGGSSSSSSSSAAAAAASSAASSH